MTPRFLLLTCALLLTVWACAHRGGRSTTDALCSHYAAPSGTGGVCTEAQPCQVRQFLEGHATPGAVLCLTDGIYTGDGSMLALTSGGGTADKPVTIRALHDGQVLIDGQFGQRPLDCNGAYWTVQGVNLKDGNDTVGVIRGQHCTVQRVVAWSTGNLMDVFDIGGAHNLLEDCGAFGYARKMIAMGARAGSGPNTVRRCWAEFNGFVPTPESGNPTHSVELGYDQDAGTFENIIAHRDLLTSASDPQAPIVLFSTWGSQILGSIAYLKGGEHYDVAQLMYIYPEGGSHEGSGHVNTDTLLKEIVTYVHPSFATVAGFNIAGGRGGVRNRADNLVGVDGAGAHSTCTAEGWNCTQIRTGTTLEAALGQGVSVWDAVPGVCRRYQDRVLTQTPLWPFPMDARFDAALVSTGRPPLALTRTMEQLFGPLPAHCLAGGTPPQPTPQPPSSVTLTYPAVTLPAMTCTGTPDSTGLIALTCAPQEGKR